MKKEGIRSLFYSVSVYSFVISSVFTSSSVAEGLLGNIHFKNTSAANFLSLPKDFKTEL